MRTASASTYTDRLDIQPGRRTRLVTLTRNDGTVERWTNGKEIVGPSSITYLPGIALRLGGPIQYHGDGSVSTATVGFPLSANGIAMADHIVDLYSDAKAEIVSFHNDGTAGFMALFTGWVGRQQAVDDKRVEFQIRSLMARGQSRLVAPFQPACRAVFGSTDYPFRCNFDLASNTDNGTVSSVTNGVTFDATFDASPARADNEYAFGAIEWLTGDLAGSKSQVRSHKGSTIKVWDARLTPEVGDTFTITIGCNKTFARCTALANQLNYQGEYLLPGPDVNRIA